MLEIIIQVKDNVICIPKPEDVKEGDLVEIRVRKIYADPELKASFLRDIHHKQQ